MASGHASGTISIVENICSRRMSRKDTSLYANYGSKQARQRLRRKELSTWNDTHLLSETDTRACVEWEEYERVLCEVSHSFVQEPVRIEDES